VARCADCGVRVGQFHKAGCDAEVCPICKGQLITCGHYRRVMRSGKRIPHFEVPFRCGLCGKPYPKLFSVSDREWKKYVPPNLQHTWLCKRCYNRLKRMFPNGWAKGSPQRRRSR